jgi:hypothetical protein
MVLTALSVKSLAAKAQSAADITRLALDTIAALHLVESGG